MNQLGLGLIYASIINLPIGYCMAVILGPWMLTIKPIRFERNKLYKYL